MWSSIAICFLVGFTFASSNPGWKDNSEYVYNIRGRTLASLHEVADQYSGIIYKSKLKIQPQSDGNLQGEISNAQYSQVHSYLPEGWSTEISDSDVSYKPLALSNSPFEIQIEDGVIKDLIVNKDVPNWEANMIKSIVSQFQLNTNGVEHIPSKLTVLPEGDDNSGVFKTMEETVTGKMETMYDIHPLPEYVLQSKPWMARHLDLKGNGEVIEVVKHKNYSNNEELPLYHYGFGDMGKWQPGTNQMGHFFIRDSISRAILTGNLKRYTIQNTYTVNEIVMSPTLNDKQKGSVVSMVNATLEEIKSKGHSIREVPSPIALGNLVYTYDNPKTGKVSQKRGGQNDDNIRRHRSPTMGRIRRAIQNSGGEDSEGSSSDSSSGSSEEYYQHEQPKLRSAPQDPLLPYNTGYKGMSIKQDPDVDIKQSVQKIAQEIGNDLQDPEQLLRENTLNKFTTMTYLIRLMDLQQLKQVAANLYSQEQDGPKRDTWTAFRDAVAESGSGPAFLTIQEWIQSGKVKDDEGADIITTAANSVREPTKEYMKSFFDFIKDGKVQGSEDLRDSSLMAYSNLVREVCFDRSRSKNEYPVNTYGKFCTEEEQKQIEESVIPYFTKELNDGVSKADTHKIHAYIRALGNVGNKKILAAFEPYLEGTKQCSQFQRLLMVVSMDKLAATDPKAARSVLYKIYQNAGESQEVRVAAVYQLMRTSPPTDILQRMASYTNIDNQEHVNAAVKSSIENAAELEGEEYYWFRSSAEAAKPLLNRKEYGVQHGQNYLRSYVIHELKLKYKQTAQYFGNEEEFYPKGLRYSVRYNLSGLKHKLASLQAMVSSVDELMHVAMYQTAEYQEQREKQQQNAQQQMQNQFSSLNIARLLNMKSEEREQLEGSLYSELHGAFQQFLAFDNKSIEELPEEIRKYEEEMRSGKTYHYTKISNSRKMSLSFPTEAGLPFLFSCNLPTIFKFEGRVSGTSTPQLSNGGKLHKPETITLETEVGLTVNSKTQCRLSFTTPFDNQRYISGFDKNFQVHVPLHGKFEVDLKNGQIEAEIENKEIHQGARLFHYSTWPFTSRVDITNFEPISAQKNTHYIKQQNLRSYDEVVGMKQTGIALRIQIEHEREFINIPRLGHFMKTKDIGIGLLKLWDDASIQYGQINIQLKPDQSSTQKYVIRAGYQEKYQGGEQGQGHGQGGQGGGRGRGQGHGQGGSPNWRQLSGMSDPLARQENLIDTIGSGIKSAKVSVCEASVEFQGSKSIKYSIIGGYGKSNVDPKSRVVAYWKQGSNGGDQRPYEMSLEAENDIPNTNGLDLSESLKSEPKVDTTVQVKFGENLESSSKAEFKVEWRRSDERKQYLQEQPMYKECQREMGDGNYQLPACANMTMDANLLDRVAVEIKHENMDEEVRDAIRSVYDVLKLNYYPTLDIDRSKGTGQDDQVGLEARFDPDLRAVNISVRVKDHEATINTIEVGEWGQKVFVAHPVFHLRSRIFGAALGLRTYRPICVVDKTHTSTFNNKTYPASLSEHWTLMLQYVPKEGRHTDQPISVEEQLKSQPENFAVLARKSSQSGEQKEVKITLSGPETDYEVIDITLGPQQGSGGGKGQVKVNGQEVQVNDRQSHDIKGGYIQIYALPNGEVKVEVEDAFYVIYDGYRAKLTVVNGKFRDSTRGLCGAFNDDRAGDFLTSEDCIARDYDEFRMSYEVEGREGSEQRREFAGQTQQCVAKDVPLYANVISEGDSGRKGQRGGSGRPSKGTKFQTRYVESDGEICFTIHPVPVCSSKHQQSGTNRKSVGVHCVQQSNIAQLWKNQIDRGASPDFSHKKESRSVQMDLPRSCSQ